MSEISTSKKIELFKNLDYNPPKYVLTRGGYVLLMTIEQRIATYYYKKLLDKYEKI